MDWKEMLEWGRGITGLVVIVITAVLGGKLWRTNRIDSARTDVVVAELEGEKQEAAANTNKFTSMTTQLEEQGKKIEFLMNRVTKLESDLNNLVSTHRTAVDLLEEIVLDEGEDSSNAILLRTVIKHLKNSHATHGNQPPVPGN